jgi:hypothetical protein
MNVLPLHRMAAGTITAAALAANSAYLIKNWTTTLTNGGWVIAPGRNEDSAKYIVKKYAERVIGLDGKYGTVGRPHDAWRIALMDDAMLATLYAVLTAESTDVTIYTPDRQKSGGAGWVTYNCIAHRPDESQLKTQGGLWYVDTLIQFSHLTIAASGV